MSFHTLVQGLRVDRLLLRPGVTGPRVEARAMEPVGDVGVGSMRGLEAIIAFTAILTAILIGFGR